MKIQMPTFEQINELATHKTIMVPPEWLDYNGHVNIQYYMTMYELGGHEMMIEMGMDESYFTERKCGVFDLEHHISYVSEVHVEETVTVHSRVVAVNKKRFQGVLFILNQSTVQVASTMEYITAATDLTTRRTAPFPDDIASVLLSQVDDSEQLSWAAPLCGCMSV